MSFPVFLPSSTELPRGSSTGSTIGTAIDSRPTPMLCRPTDATLGLIFAELTAARTANQRDRGVLRPGSGSGARSDRLLISLEACVTALTERNLPIPPSLRDELRLRRNLWAART
jgi:hypothetical protein